MNNHFFIPYSGNKRTEVKNIYDAIIKNNSLENISTIIEPYCGTSAISYYISTLYPKKYNYILNDINSQLIELYKIFSDINKITEFIKKINLICFDKDLKFMNKIDYCNLMKQKKTNIEAFFIGNKYYFMNAYRYPDDKVLKLLEIDKILKTPIIDFLQNENIIFSSDDAIKVVIENNNNKSLIINDPPYIMTDNSMYSAPKINIYEWLYDNQKILYNSCFILEHNWIIQLLFKDNTKKYIYEKKYTGMTKKTVDHVIAFYNL